MIIAVDFDGTIVEHKYPSIGREKPFAIETLRQLAADGHKLILWTVRHGETLDQALEWCAKRGLEFYAVNSNYPAGSLFAGSKDSSPKIEADVFIDDHNIGGMPDWAEIYQIINDAHQRHHSHRHGRSNAFLKKLFGL